MATTGLRWVTAGYGWFTLVAPLMAAAPAYFQGSLSFGEMMVAAGAFNQVQQALRWYVDNFSVIADWRATLVRVASFRRAIVRTDQLDVAGQRIEVVPSAAGELSFAGLQVATPGGCATLKEGDVVIAPGERVAIVGGPRAGKTMLFRAIAGLWPWGVGTIELPPRETMAFLPRHPYTPPGTLRAVLAYPKAPEGFHDDEYAASLSAVGLGRLAAELGRVARWDRELGEEDRQALAFARLPLQKPRWIIIDDALDTLYPEQQRRVITILRDVLKDVAIVNIGRGDAHDGLFTRQLHLARDPAGRSFVPARHVRRRVGAAAEPAQAAAG
jgi:putative ATP-binding cassette transporter